MTNILLIILIQFVIILLIVVISYNPEREPIKRVNREEMQQEEKNYLTLQNMTTYEIMTFKNKNDFYKTIDGFDTVRYFLKGTEQENINQLIKWYYPGYRAI